ncbi:MAG: hypothetical protein NE334_18700 [Lentisphaeraceae bacterium]|nr:hypothetical protein [Lentisphaeraceae bacterium]
MKTLIIGNGFCGAYLNKALPSSDIAELPEKAVEGTIPFDLRDESQWSLFYDYKNIIITCKIDTESLGKKLALFLNKKFVIVLSTAKAFTVSKINEFINEASKLEKNLRNLAEAHFEKNANILHLGLIWGGNRQPQKWLEQGRIKNGNKMVNLIHVDDICYIINHLIKSQMKAGRILVSDNTPITWQNIASKHGIKLPSKPLGIESKQFHTQKLKKILPKDYKFKFLFE